MCSNAKDKLENEHVKKFPDIQVMGEGLRDDLRHVFKHSSEVRGMRITILKGRAPQRRLRALFTHLNPRLWFRNVVGIVSTVQVGSCFYW